jgi:hypothetical protein
MQGNYFCLVPLEESVGLQVVEYCGHIALPVAPAADLSGIGFQHAAVGSYQYAKHLAARNLLTPFGMSLDICQDFLYVWLEINYEF